MTVRFASFNVENLFARPRAFNQTTWALGQPILDAYREFNSLIALAAYTPADKRRMIELLVELDVYRDDSGIVRRKRTPTPGGRGCVRTEDLSTLNAMQPVSTSSRTAVIAGSAG